MISALPHNTKIICTIGPASESRGVIKELIKAGMRGARLNFSHGTYEHHQLLVENVRAASEELGISCAVIQDLQGPKIRVGTLYKPIEVSANDEVMLVPEGEVEPLLRTEEMLDKVVPLQYNLASEVKEGDIVLIDDGLVELTVKRVRKNRIYARVKTGGPIGGNKGINVPGREVAEEVITAKDKEDLKFGVSLGVDAVALSFVKDAENITQLRGILSRCIKKNQIKPLIIAKIERACAVAAIDEIIDASDGIMIARGDLGLEVSSSDVPIIQKEIVSKCLRAYKPVIVATQMLDSMIRNPRPTRAEASDVAAAVVDHADALMLSGETAYGKYPLQSCRTMTDIIGKTEKSPYDDLAQVPLRKGATDEEAVARAAWSLALEVRASMILATTITGKTARMITRFRPQVPILVTCESEAVERQLVLLWGVVPFILPAYPTIDALIEAAVRYVKKADLVKRGDKIIIISGQPVGKGGTNLVKIHTV